MYLHSLLDSLQNDSFRPLFASERSLHSTYDAHLFTGMLVRLYKRFTSNTCPYEPSPIILLTATKPVGKRLPLLVKEARTTRLLWVRLGACLNGQGPRWPKKRECMWLQQGFCMPSARYHTTEPLGCCCLAECTSVVAFGTLNTACATANQQTKFGLKATHPDSMNRSHGLG